MGSHYPALEWLSLRHDGESPALIADRAGVPVAAVTRAADPYGLFPRPTRQLGRVIAPEAMVDARTARWVHLRRNEVRVTEIAPGRAHLTRSSAGQHSPRAVPKTHPSLETVKRWEKDRRAGIPATTIAAAAWRQRRPDPAGHPAARAVPSRGLVPRRGARCARSRPARRNLPTNCPQMERHRLHATCRDRHRHRTPALVQVHAYHLA